MSEDDPDVKPVPVRSDGTYRSFWYDPDRPMHIFHRRSDGQVYPICVGHFHE